MAGSEKNPIVLFERDATILIKEGFSERFVLTPDSARWLAKQLTRMARRIEGRQQ